MRVEDFFAAEWPQEVPRLRRLLARNGIAYDDMEDVLQESAMRLHAAWGRVFEDRPLRPLVTTIVLNVARDHHRRANYGVQPVETVPEPAVADEPGVEQAVIGRLELQRASRALAALPEKHRRVVVTAVSHELEGEQRGRNRAPAAARMALSRARRQLVAVMEITAAAFGVAFAGMRRRFPAPGPRTLASAGFGVVVLSVVMLLPGTSAPVPKWQEAEESRAPVVGKDRDAVMGDSRDSGAAGWSKRWSYDERQPRDVAAPGNYAGTVRWVPPRSPLLGVDTPAGDLDVGPGDSEPRCELTLSGHIAFTYPCEWTPWTPTSPNMFAGR